MDDPEPTALLKPPLWAMKMRRLLLRTGLPALLSGLALFAVALVGSVFIAPFRRGGMGIWDWITLGSVLLICYGLGGLLLRLFVPSLMQFSLRGLLGTILTLGTCISAWMSDSPSIKIAGFVILLTGVGVALHFNAKNEARFEWPEK